MAQASPSKMTLDAVDVLLAASLAKDYPGPSQRQTDTLPFHSTRADDADAESDYDSDGFCTPPLPSQEQLSQATTYFSPGSHTSNDNQQSMPSNMIKSKISPASTYTINGMVLALPTRNEVPDAEGYLETVVVKMEIDKAAAPIDAPKRKRGRPPGSTNARKLQRQQEMNSFEQARASSSCEIPEGGEKQASPAVASRNLLPEVQDSIAEGEVVAETNEFTAQRQLDQLEQALERGKAYPEDRLVDVAKEKELQREALPIDVVLSQGVQDQEARKEKSPEEVVQQQDLQKKEAQKDEAQDQEVQEEEVQEEELREEVRSPTPEQALLPDFIFEPPDDSMFAELRAFLDQEEADTTVSSSDEEKEEDDIGLAIYERRRLKKLRANEAILSKLGLGQQQSFRSPIPDLDDEEREESAPLASPVRIQGRKVYKPPIRSVRLDPDGTTTSLPLPGCTFEVAYVDMPVLRPRIRLQHKFHDEIPVLPPRTEPLSEEEWEEELLSPPSPIKKVTKIAKKRPPVGPGRGLIGEALEGKGTTCHQCRNKTEEPKMRCRYHEGGRVCPLFYCERCLKIRYDIDFDEDSRTFECPRCLAYCNCSLCIHRAGLSKICGGSLGARLLDGEGNRLYASVKHYLDAKVGRPVKIGAGGLIGKPKTMTRTTSTADTIEGEEESSSTQKEKKVRKQRKEKTEKRVTKEKKEKTEKRERKRKAAEEAAPGEAKKRKGKAKKQQDLAKEVENGEVEMKSTSTSTPLEEDSELISRTRKIKLTFKAKATAEEEELKRQRIKHDRGSRSVNAPRERKVQFARPAMAAVRRGRPPAAKKKVPQIIEAANVWVKSKADVAPSSSDSELEKSTWKTMSEDSDLTSSNESDQEGMADVNGLSDEIDHRSYDSEMDDGAGQDNPRDEDSSSMQGTADSPQAGQVEFTHHPELTLTEYSMNTPHSVFQSNGLIPFVEDTHAFAQPTAPELTDFLQQLMGAGVI